jgi:uncharacterized membrane protein
MSILSGIKTVIKRNFVSGLLVTVPVITTYFVLRILFNALDGIFNPIVHDLLGYDIPGLGAVVTILLILLAGIVTTNYIGARIYELGDRSLGRTPLVRIIYTAAKQLVRSLVTPSAKAFSEVALVEYPRKGVYIIGFLSGKSRLQDEENKYAESVRMVFIPSTPTPFTGLVVFVPERDIYPIDIGLEEAVKIMVSGGIATPPVINMIKERKCREATHATG